MRLLWLTRVGRPEFPAGKGQRSKINKEEEEEESLGVQRPDKTCRVRPGGVTQLQFCDTSAKTLGNEEERRLSN